MPFFAHNDVIIFYTTHGSPSTTPVLLNHGWACDSHDWSYLIPFLLSLNFYVIALDLRGHGRSSGPSDSSSYSMHTFADDVVALAKHLNLSPVILIAHSMGTIIASIIAVEQPDVIKGVVYVHPIYCGTPPQLKQMSDSMQSDPSSILSLAYGFFENAMYTSRTPDWLKTWQLRRLLGTDPIALAGSIRGVVELFDTVVGRNEQARRFMNSRKGPRLVVCTNGIPIAEGWEKELDVGDTDRVESMEEATFSHMVEWEKFNDILEQWLREREFLPKS